MTKFKFNLRKMIAIAICLAASSATVFAQDYAIRVMKDGVDVFSYAISGSEKIVFKDPAGGTTPTSGDELIVKRKSGETAKTLLDNINEIKLADGLLSVIPFSGTSAVYAISNVATLSFGKSGTGINAPQMPEMDVRVWLNQSGDIVVESAAGILSLTLYTIEGKMIANEKCGGSVVETLHATSLPVGFYLIRIGTPQGTAVKKLIINN